MENIINDPEADQKLKLAASKTILDRAGVIAPKAREPAKSGKFGEELSSLSIPELRAFIAKGKAKLAETAVPSLVGSASA